MEDRIQVLKPSLTKSHQKMLFKILILDPVKPASMLDEQSQTEKVSHECSWKDLQNAFAQSRYHKL